MVIPLELYLIQIFLKHIDYVEGLSIGSAYKMVVVCGIKSVEYLCVQPQDIISVHIRSWDSSLYFLWSSGFH